MARIPDEEIERLKREIPLDRRTGEELQLYFETDPTGAAVARLLQESVV